MKHALTIAAETRNTSSSHVQVLCTNELLLCLQKFLQHEQFDGNLTLWRPAASGIFG